MLWNIGQKTPLNNTNMTPFLAEIICTAILILLGGGDVALVILHKTIRNNSDVIVETKVMLVDAKDVAKFRFGNNGTFIGFRYEEPSNRQIDQFWNTNRCHMI